MPKNSTGYRGRESPLHTWSCIVPAAERTQSITLSMPGCAGHRRLFRTYCCPRGDFREEAASGHGRRVVVRSARRGRRSRARAPEFVGVHCRLGGKDAAGLPDIVLETVATMACFNRETALFCRDSASATSTSRRSAGSRADCAGCRDDRRSSGEGCVRFRCPRPALTLSPCRSTFMPTT